MGRLSDEMKKSFVCVIPLTLENAGGKKPPKSHESQGLPPKACESQGQSAGEPESWKPPGGGNKNKT